MYEIFEHTADVGIRVRADNVDELFADAAQGLFSLLVGNPDLVHATQEETFQLRADTLDELLHDWLGELLYAFYARRLLLTDFHVHVENPKEARGPREDSGAGASPHPTRLAATAQGQPINPDLHEIGAEVKAITWHGLKVEKQAGGWVAEVIVDI